MLEQIVASFVTTISEFFRTSRSASSKHAHLRATGVVVMRGHDTLLHRSASQLAMSSSQKSVSSPYQTSRATRMVGFDDAVGFDLSIKR